MRRKHRHINGIYTLILWVLLSFIGLYATTEIGTEIENIAYARYQDPSGFEYEIQSPPVITTVSGGYIVHITKEVMTHVVMPLDTAVYRIHVENTGNIPVSSLTVIDTLSNGLTIVSSQPSTTVDGKVLSWDLQNIQPGATQSIELRFLVAPGLLPGTILENQVYFRTVDDVVGHSETVEILVGSEPDLSINYEVDHLEAFAGDTLTYVFRVVNKGNAQATRTILRADLPFETEFVSYSGAGNLDAGIVTWDLGILPVGDETSETVRAVVKSGVKSGTMITTTASVESAEGSHANTQVLTQISDQVLQPKLSLDRTFIPFAEPGDTLTYRIIYGNLGNSSATETVLMDSLDARLIFLSASDAASYDALTHRITWNLEVLSDGEEDSVMVNVIVQKAIPDGSILEDHSRISCSEDQSAAITRYTTIRSPQLILQKTADSSYVSAGEDILYSIAYRNIGNGSASQTILRDTLASTLEYLSSDGSSSYNSETHVVSWELGQLPSQMSASEMVHLRVKTKIPLENGTVIHNSISMSCYEGFDAHASADVNVTSSADLYLDKTVQSRAYRGDTLNYVLSFGNTGNDIAHTVSITDTLAEEINLISAKGTYNYDAASRCISWSIGDLTPGVDSTLWFKAIILDIGSQIDRIENQAWIHTSEISIGSNTTVTRLNALLLSISADPDTIMGNGETETQITVNASDASGQAAADGTPIKLSTSLGNFTSSSNTFTTVNGKVQTALRSTMVDQEYVPVMVKAELDDGSGVEDSIQVVFSALRIIGIVSNNDGSPVEGAIITILLDGVIIGTDTTGTDGIYSIAIYASGDYTIRIQYPDGHGNYNTVEKDLDVNIDESDQPTTVDDLCSVSGRIVDYYTADPINIPNIPVIIRSGR